MPFSQIFRDPPLVLWPLKIKVLIPILDAFPFFFSHLNHSLVFTKLKQINLVRNSLTFIFGWSSKHQKWANETKQRNRKNEALKESQHWVWNGWGFCGDRMCLSYTVYSELRNRGGKKVDHATAWNGYRIYQGVQCTECNQTLDVIMQMYAETVFLWINCLQQP